MSKAKAEQFDMTKAKKRNDGDMSLREISGWTMDCKIRVSHMNELPVRENK